MKKLTGTQLKARLEKHRKWIYGEKGGERADFVKVDLSGLNLYSANLEAANLRAANLEAANLEAANLRAANLEAANLYSANLYSANLEAANLRAANLYSANLEAANLRAANLYSANLRAANLEAANLGAANLGAKTFLGCMLRLIGACQESVEWVDEQDQSDLNTLFHNARPEWRSWIVSALGGHFTAERLGIVFGFVTARVHW